jgi:glycerol-3-phosphate acyltransferase PlsY
LVVRALRGVDIRTVGDGNMGTQNVWQAVGPFAALLVFAGDMAKGAAAVLLPPLLGAPLFRDGLRWSRCCGWTYLARIP